MTRTTAADAMATAKQAQADISAHEQVCAERYKHIAESGARVEGAVSAMADAHAKAIDGIYKRLWWFAAGIVGFLGSGMFAIIMALIFK